MYLTASRSLKIAYAIVVLAAVVPIGLASSGWVALATGRGGAAIPYIGPILFLVLGIYRVATVYRNPQALHSYPVKGFVNVLRKIGVFALYFGALVGVLNLVSRPLMAALITHRSENGIELFVVGIYLAMLGGIGFLGLITFELSRLLGFEEHSRAQTIS